MNTEHKMSSVTSYFALCTSPHSACIPQGRRDMNTVVYSYGSAQCQININSSTTAGEVSQVILHAQPKMSLFRIPFHSTDCNTVQVVQTLTLGLKVSAENNRFALFEMCGRQVKVIDDRAILADVLGKFERYIFMSLSLSVCFH